MRLVCGIGVSDAAYRVAIRETVGRVDGKQIQKLIWECPIYRRWVDLIRRVHTDKNKFYNDCYISTNWLVFSNFHSWAKPRFRDGLCLDKDILVRGNKIYSEDTCAFVPLYVNNCILYPRNKKRGLPLGVHTRQGRNKLRAVITEDGKSIHLGNFSDPLEAHLAWQLAKISKLESVLEKYKSDESYIEAVGSALSCRINSLKESNISGIEVCSI